MSNYRLTHDLDEDPTVYDGHVLSEALEFSDGEAIVADEETARALARRHTHVVFAGRVDDDTDADVPAEESEVADEIDELLDGTVDEVRDAIEAGDYDDRLDDIAGRADRQGVEDAVDDRHGDVEG